MNPTATATDMGTDEVIAAAIALLESVVHAGAPGRLSGERFLSRVPRVERLGRLVDSLRVSHAADAAERMMSPVDSLGAAGYATAQHAIAQLTGVSEAEAARRIRLGQRIASGVSMTGAPVAPRFPSVASAVGDGHLGLEAAEIITRQLDTVACRVDRGVLHEAEAGLVELASGTDVRAPTAADLVKDQAAVFILAIDPDGAEPSESYARRARSLTFGRATPEGMIPVKGLLAADVGVQFERLVSAHVRRVSFVDPVADEQVAAEDRSPAQRRHDTLADILSAASRVADAPEIAGSAPAVTVTVTHEALVTGDGMGFLDGHVTPVSIDTVDRLIDSRGMQVVTMNAAGRVLSLGSTQRCFTPSQRRAIAARDGGCIIPGCTTPAGWCEVHHVIPWRSGGPTHTDNGVLLCWGHHQRIDRGPWRLSMPDGVPHVRGPGIPEWTPAGRSRVRTAFPRTG
ncbi:5-methylcytosine-specific restriction protein A [Labedella gwakjiensis]|uniref:5-methylcytosine-specific restriction protein A n=1 Tax=Labedella gwakjiensis TaxID=390269 RepID=A0A2P8GX91_9MICO|nr:HNH endonuclease signature motif containing protein [Labedella gwakjiensis]PSL38588.1 5-methylcytosine-specific restriction protein A [Labedella gwakjiensis]RUQ86907.1 HNH endonuclease [Labedella gwakjiensis]